MKVNLDEMGALVIRAEGSVESFALSHWYNLWRDSKAILRVETVEAAGTAPVLGDVGPQ